MYYLEIDNSAFGVHRIVTLRPSFEQADATGTIQTLAYADTVHDLADLSLVEVAGFGVRPPGTPRPAYGSGSYRLLTDDDVAALRGKMDAVRRNKAAQAANRAAAIQTLAAIPTAAAAEMATVQATYDRLSAVQNEGGDGFAPIVRWNGAAGRAIAARHGLDADALAHAERTLAR